MVTPVASPFGFKLVSTLASATMTGALPNPNFQIQPGYATNIFYGAPVTLSGGWIIPATGAASTPLLGIFIGCQYTSPTSVANVQQSKWWPASTATVTGTTIECYILWDPLLVYEVQSSTNPGILQANVGNNVDFTVQTGNTATGQSTVALSSTPPATTAALPLKILGIAPTATTTTTNVSGGAYNTVLVKINNHILMSNGTTGNA